MSDMSVVTVDAVLDLCRELGCAVTPLKSYYAVEAPEYNKKCLYVGMAKRRLTRLDIAGFVPEAHPAIFIKSAEWAKEMKLGAVRGQILPKELRPIENEEGEEETIDVLEGVRAAVRGLLSEEEGFKLGKRKAKEEDVEAALDDSSQDDEEEETLDEEDFEEIEDEDSAEAVA